jgi:hypothetical protein
MATIKISDLAELTSPSDVTSTDLLHIINKDQTSSEYPTGTNRSIKASTLANGLGGLLTTIPPVIQTALNAKLNTSAYDPAGIKVATPVRAASTVTLTLSGINNGSSIDGVTLATGDRVLIKNQSTTTENGIYVVRASGGLIRATDFASGTNVKGYFVLVTAGTTQNGSGWAVTSDPAVIGTNSIIFTQFSSALGSVTKESLGLGNVDNTSDLNKPISTLTQTALNTKQATITGAASTITTTNLTASRVLVSDGNGKVAASSITSTELDYLDNVSSNIQTQLNGKASTSDLATKQNIITGAASTITTSFLTANRALVSDGNGRVAASSITSTELGYLSGVTSNIQTQLDAKGTGNGTVTSVTGTAPISVSNGTSTPAISIAAATTSAAGTMSSTDKTRLDDASGVNGLVKCNGSGNFSAAAAADIPGIPPSGAVAKAWARWSPIANTVPAQFNISQDFNVSSIILVWDAPSGTSSYNYYHRVIFTDSSTVTWGLALPAGVRLGNTPAHFFASATTAPANNLYVDVLADQGHVIVF